MSRMTDRQFLMTRQYVGAENLRARIALHQRFSTSHYDWHRWMFDHIELAPSSSLLEIGCGPADFWRKNADRLPPSCRVVLSDLSRGMMLEARHALAAAKYVCSFEVADAQALPHAGACFDAVLASHMLYHVPDLPAALQEVRRVLRPGGVLYATTIGDNHLIELFDLIAGFDPKLLPPQRASDTSFTLDNGAQVLEQWFDAVTLVIHDDALVVTEAEPLAAYIRSTTTASAITAEQYASLLDFVAGEIAAHGPIRITKASGMFKAARSG